MSHLKERSEKNCLNCGAEVQGRYCGICGQENIEPRESVWHLITHFFYDVTHFDGKFFTTVRLLLLKPGFLTAEYVKGKRASHLHPVRMYVFTSAFFFLIFFSFISSHTKEKKEGVEALKEVLSNKEEGLKGLNEMLAETGDTVLKNAGSNMIARYEREIRALTEQIKKEKAAEKERDTTSKVIPDAPNGLLLPIDINTGKDSKGALAADSLSRKTNESSMNFVKWFRNEATYSAFQNELPSESKDGLFTRSIRLKVLHWYQENQKGTQKFQQVLTDKFRHSFPAMLFVSLPFFALFLKVLYIRRTRFYYVDHGIFAIHAYCALFVLMLLYYMLDALGKNLHWWLFSMAKVVMILYVVYYVYKAMRNFYGQGRFKTLLKYFLLSVMTLMVMTILVLLTFIISAYKI